MKASKEVLGGKVLGYLAGLDESILGAHLCIPPSTSRHGTEHYVDLNRVPS